MCWVLPAPVNKLGEARLRSRARRRRPRSRLLGFFAETLFEFSLCLRRFSSNDLIRPARAFGGSDFRFIIRLAKSGMMRRWRKKAAG